MAEDKNMLLNLEEINKFWLKVNKKSGIFGQSGQYPTECWIWLAGKNGDGYGRFYINSTQYPAHRIAFILANNSINEKWPLDHLCKNPSCVRPDHLENISNEINIKRGTSNAAINAKKVECYRGHEFSKENTGYNQDGSRYCQACSRLRVRKPKQGLLKSELRTYCPQGHPYNETNTRIVSYAIYEKRRCLACQKNQWLARKSNILAAMVGDIHGKFREAEILIENILKKFPKIDIILHPGDLAFGWTGSFNWDYPFDIPFFWCRGNHDNTDFLEKNQFPSWMHYKSSGSLSVFAKKRILWNGGATSIDRSMRIPGVSWWSGESITTEELNKCLEINSLINLLITHEKAKNYEFNWNFQKFPDGASDREAIQQIVDKFKPSYHVFGHYHEPDNGVYYHQDGTKTEWTCLPEIISGHYAIYNGETIIRSWE